MTRALLIVDFDTSGGARAVPRGIANALAASGDVELAPDRRPLDHGAFVERGGIWPVHCPAASEGAESHPALDALGLGFRVTVDAAAVRGVNVEPGGSERALEELRRAGATVG